MTGEEKGEREERNRLVPYTYTSLSMASNLGSIKIPPDVLCMRIDLLMIFGPQKLRSFPFLRSLGRPKLGRRRRRRRPLVQLLAAASPSMKTGANAMRVCVYT